MVFFWFILGTIAITLIARYNESDKLFWKLFLAFVLGFASCKMYYHLTQEQNKPNLTQVCPTQASTELPGIAQFFLAGNSPEITFSNSCAPVSKVYAPAQSEISLILSKVAIGARDQPPPLTSRLKFLGSELFFNTS